MATIKKELTIKERMLKCFIAFSIPFLLITIVFGQASLAQVNREVEIVKSEISTQKQTNESLSMKRDELLSFEKINAIAKNEGLAYNNNNIKNIDE